jgi:hypothetical protein
LGFFFFLQLLLASTHFDRARAQPLYGCSLFQVKWTKINKPCILALNERVLQVWDVQTNLRTPLKTIEYDDVASWGPKPGTHRTPCFGS